MQQWSGLCGGQSGHWLVLPAGDVTCAASLDEKLALRTQRNQQLDLGHQCHDLSMISLVRVIHCEGLEQCLSSPGDSIVPNELRI